MIRTQIQLEEEKYRKLQRLAREQQISMAEIVRLGIDLALGQLERQKRWDKARSLVGKYASHRKDVSQKHDKHLSQIYK